ncbi:helix-turn-helix domain-containing protein [Fulvivirgaceae bacterium BMA10]|uniref:Helix-turn-helix domain-containing protein n=1 Tax=Splendidivirga corallicola TaxID=3051826 RepID=A0ABT8KLU3_9BACT|nr:helix-turn-helix domain-containing protein [Fulvivirgaceae bacterium BMA10]
MKKGNLRSDCPINYALEYLGDKWTLLVIRDLVFEGKKFYKEFLNSKEGIATNILSDRLKRLENLGIVESKVYEKLRTQKIYALSEKGKDLIPILVEIILWSSKHKNGLNVSAEFVNKLEKNKMEVIKSITENVGGKKFSANP